MKWLLCFRSIIPVIIFDAFSWWHPRYPQQANPTNQLFFIQRLHISSSEVFQFSPNTFSWIEICTTGRGWPPIDVLFLIVGFCNRLVCFGSLFCIKWYSVPRKCFSSSMSNRCLSNIWMYNTPSIIWSKTRSVQSPIMASRLLWPNGCTSQMDHWGAPLVAAIAQQFLGTVWVKEVSFQTVFASSTIARKWARDLFPTTLFARRPAVPLRKKVRLCLVLQ